jgi:hypothetical protein
MQTEETRHVEGQLRAVFPGTDAYRYNSASIRVRIIDPCFEGKTDDERDAMIEPLILKLPEETQRDIINLLALAPGELKEFNRRTLLNEEFEDPSPSKL